MPKLDPYLTFDGTCAEAFRFYEKVIGGKIEALLTFGSSPMAGQLPASHADRIMHAKLRLDGGVLMGADAVPGHPYEGIKGITLALDYPTVAEAHATFAALAEGGSVRMPIEKSF